MSSDTKKPNENGQSPFAEVTGSATVTNYHLCQSVRGPLTNWTPKQWKRATQWIKKNDGTAYEPFELKQAFLDELARGHEVVPIGECDNFDWKEGCKGHPTESPNEPSSATSGGQGATNATKP